MAGARTSVPTDQDDPRLDPATLVESHLRHLAPLDASATVETLERLADGPWRDLLLAAHDVVDDPAAARTALSSVIEGFAATDDDRGRAWALALTGEAVMHDGHFDKALAWWAAALEVAPEDFPPRPILADRAALDAHRRGDVQTALARAMDAHAAAVALDDPWAVAHAMLYLSVLALETGWLTWADHVADQLRELPVDEASAIGVPGTTVALITKGRVAALRRRWDEAEAHFDTALAEIGGTHDWARGSFEAYRAMCLAEASTAHAEEALASLGEPDGTEVDGDASRWHLLAQARALGVVGRTDEAVAELRRARRGWTSAFDVLVSRIWEAEALLADGRADEALPPLEEARATVEAWQAPYWTARVLTDLAQAAPDRAGELLARRALLRDGDPAVEVLDATPVGLRVDLGVEAGVEADGASVAFTGRQAEFVVLALVALGERGLAVGDLVGLLWPAPDPARVPQRLRTLLWQVRRGLGEEAWRFRRAGDRLSIDLRGMEVVWPRDADGTVALDRLLGGWDHLGIEPVAWVRGRLRAQGGASAE